MLSKSVIRLVMIGNNELLRAKVMDIEFKWFIKADMVRVERLTTVSMGFMFSQHCSKWDD